MRRPDVISRGRPATRSYAVIPSGIGRSSMSGSPSSRATCSRTRRGSKSANRPRLRMSRCICARPASASIASGDRPAASAAPMIAPMLVPTMRRGRMPRRSSARATPTCAQPRAPPPPSASVKPSANCGPVIGQAAPTCSAHSHEARSFVYVKSPVSWPSAQIGRERVAPDPAHLGQRRLPLVEEGLERHHAGKAPLAGAERARARAAEGEPRPLAEVAVVPPDAHPARGLVELDADGIHDLLHHCVTRATAAGCHATRPRSWHRSSSAASAAPR